MDYNKMTATTAIGTVDAGKADTVVEKPAEKPVIPATPKSKMPVGDGTAKPSFVMGEVINCDRLRVRKEANPDPKIEVVATVNNGCKLRIDMDRSTRDFYAVSVSKKVKGFCKKEFIKMV